MNSVKLHDTKYQDCAFVLNSFRLCKNFATNNITYITDCKSATFQGKKMPSKLWVLGSNPNRIT